MPYGGTTPEQDKKIEKCVNKLLADPDFKPKKKEQTKKEAAISVCKAQIMSEGDNKMENFSLKITDYIKFEDVEQEETEEGLILKGIPIFHAGNHRGKKYTEEKIDEYINNFEPDEDIPVQADHSDSVWETLGYIKNVYREGKRLFGDLLLIDENAITRWKRKLMKKWSLAINPVKNRVHHLAPVPFPQVKEAAVHSEGELSDVSYEDLVEEFRWISVKEENDMPDSHFLWVKDEKTDNKTKDRKLPYKGPDGKINRSGIKGAYNALQGARGGVELSSGPSKSEVISKLIKAIRSYNKQHPDNKFIPSELKEKLSGINAEILDLLEENKNGEVNKTMAKDKEAKELLKEAAEEQERLLDEKKELEGKIDSLKEKNEELEGKLEESTSQLKEADVNSRISELKEEGKIIPAQEDKIKEHMLELEKEELDSFTEILKSAKKEVDLEEHGEQDSDKEEKEESLDDYSEKELVKKAEEIAEEKGIEFDEAYTELIDKLSE